MGTTPEPVQIPGKAVSDEADIRLPVRVLLKDLNLLSTKAELDEAGAIAAAFKGPPQSVALIEAGATAAAKWWAAGLGTLVIAAWGSVANWWPTEGDTVKAVVVGGAAFVTAALVIAIGYLIASDVRGRAAASVSLIEARASVAAEMIRAAKAVYKPTSAAAPVEIVPLASRVLVKNHRRPADDEDGWRALAMERRPEGNHYIVVKGSSEDTLPPEDLDFQ
jgi:hypothetical protein